MPGVVDQPGRHPVGNVFRPDEVPAADLLAAEIQRAGRRVDHRLHGEDTGRAGDAPIRTGRRGVRGHAAHRAVVVRQPVGAAEQPARHQRLDPGGPRVAGVRAGVAGDVGAQRQQAAVPGETRLYQVAVVTGVAGGQQVLAAVLDPLDRRARQCPRHQAQRHILGIQPGLDAERAAHVGRDDPDAVFGQAEQLGDDVPDDVRDLGARPEGEAAPLGLPQRQAGPAFHRVARVPVGDQLTLHDEVRGREGGLGVARREGPGEQDVVGRFVVHRGLGPGVPGRHGDRQRGVVHVDQRERVLGQVTAVCHHGRDRLAREAGLAGGQDRLRGLDVTRQGGPGVQRGVAEILSGEHGPDARQRAGLAGVDGVDPGVRVRAAQEGHVPGPGRLEVGHVGPAAGDQPQVLLAGHRCADGVLHRASLTASRTRR